MTQIKPDTNTPSRWPKLPKAILFITGALLAVLVGLHFVSQLESVQNWYGNRIAGYINNKTGFELKISGTQINLFKGVQLRDFELLDHHSELMFQGKMVSAGLSKNLLSFLFYKSLNINSIEIRNARLNLTRYPGEEDTNLSIFLKKLTGPPKDGTSCSQLIIKRVFMEDVLIEDSSNESVTARYGLEKGKFSVDKIDLCDQLKLSINTADITGGLVKFEFFPEKNGNYISGNHSSSEKPFTVFVKKLNLADSQFELINQRSEHNYSKGIDYNHLLFENLEMETQNLTLDTDLNISAKIDHIAFEEKSGLVVKAVEIPAFMMNREMIDLSKMQFETANSFMEMDAQLQFDGFDALKNIADELYIIAKVKESDLQTSDIFYFAPKLSENQFFRDISSKHIEFKGLIRGTINNLKINDIDLVIAGESKAMGSFSSKNITVPEQALMNIRLNSLTSNTHTITKLIPDLKVPVSFHKLGNLHFTGSFDGFLHDFVAFGKLQTDLGQITTDMRLQLSKTDALSSYSGNIGLKNFEAGKLLDIPEMGQITMSTQVQNGKGFDKKNFKADLNAKIDSLDFRNYVYQNFSMKGTMNQEFFNGEFVITDENITLNFSGLINYGKEIPVINIHGKADRINLAQLNLSDQNISLKTDFDIDIIGKSAADLEGKFVVREMLLKNDDKQIYVDSAMLATRLTQKGERFLDFTSEFLSFYFDGKYDIVTIPDALYSLLNKNFPELTAPLNYKPKATYDIAHFYDFYIYIPDSKALLEIFQEVEARAEDITLNGSVNYARNRIDVTAEVGKLTYGDLYLNDFNAFIDINNDYGTIQILGKELKINDLVSDFFSAVIELNDNIALYQITANTRNQDIGNISLKGLMEGHENGFQHQIKTGNIDLYGKTWYVIENGHLVIGKNYIELDNLGLSRNDQNIYFEDMNDFHGVKAILHSFDADILNSILKMDQIQLSGKTEGFILFPEFMKGNFLFEGAVRSNELYINNEPFGKVTAVIQNDPVSQNFLNITASLSNNIHRIDFDGKLNKSDRNLNSIAKLQKFPLSFLEIFLDDVVSETKGYVDGEVRLFGNVKSLDINGSGTVYEGSTIVNYLGTTYTFNDQKAKITGNYLDLTGIEIQDTKNNKALIKGGLKHNMFQNIIFDLSLESDGLEVLSTTESQNPDFFGYAMASFITRFTGPVEKANILVDATVFPVSYLTIPVDNSTSTSSQSFIKFNNNTGDLQAQPVSIVQNSGLAIEMNLTIQNGASINIFLDDKAGDNIKGQGTGDIRIVVPRVGDIEMYGSLTIESGTYLFTAINLIQKPFSIRKGGRISWTGRVLDAEIDLFADYRNESVSLSNFLSKEIKISEGLAEVARKRTPVDVVMHLTGSLLRPDISFDLDFPSLDAEARSAAFSKLQKLRADQNLMYTQSVALLSMGTFLPEDDITAFDPNRLYSQYGWEFASVMISRYLTGIFEELVQNSAWITGVDVDVNFINNSMGEGAYDDSNFFPDAYGYGAKVHIFDNKASIEYAGNYVHRAVIAQDRRYVNNGFVFKYYFTKDRRLRIEAYSKNEFDEIFEIRRWKSGIGLSFTHEFGSIEDMKQDIETELNKLPALN